MTTSTSNLRGHYKRWRLADPVAGGESLAAALRVDALVGQLLAQRGIHDADVARRFIHPTLKDLHDPVKLPGAVKAAHRIAQALRADQTIVIYGDYDVDGITAASILYHMLRTAKPDAKIMRYVPHRIDEGYGLSADALASLIDNGANLIISVDCGITAVEPAAVAKQRGVDLIITDHHEMGAALPDAFALVHPRLEADEPYPFAELCGAGVAYKLAWQIARVWTNTERVPAVFSKLLVDLLPLAALGTIADVVPLVDENRTIAHCGLRHIKDTPFLGLNALIDAARLRGEAIDSYHVGFVLGPRLNACGRMGHAREAVKLLTDAPPDEAKQIAEMLNGENDRRRATEREIFEQARAMVTESGYDRDDVRAIVLADARWHKGVVGIVCSRLVEAFGRPTVLMNIADGEAAGSARSIDGFNIHEAFTACADHLRGYGGHAMAAGLQMDPDHVGAFRDAMIEYAAAHLKVEDLTPMLVIDAVVELASLSVDAVKQIQKLAPFGRCNPHPMLLFRDVTLHQPARTMGQQARHLSLIAHQNGAAMRCVGWNMGSLAPKLPAGMTLDLVAEPTLNHFNGRTTVELILKDLRWETSHD